MKIAAMFLGAAGPLLLAVPSGSAASYQCFGEAATIVGPPGNDIVDLTTGHDVVVTLGGDDIVRPREAGGPDTICLGPGNDRASATASADWVDGGEGNDHLGAGFGDDLVLGGPGDDIIHGGGERDTIRGGPGNDELYGDSHDDTVLGEGGNDTLWGDYGHGRVPTGDDESGDDVLDGGAGHDRLDGEGETLFPQPL